MNRTWWHALLRRNPSLRRKTLDRIRQANRQALKRHQHLQLETLESRLVLTAGPVPSDFGDAPEQYATFGSDNGPVHILSGLCLGSEVDAEDDAFASQNADGDGDDDDGVTFGRIFAQGDSAFVVQVTGAGPGAKLDAWLDWNADGDWNDAGEQIATSIDVVDGLNAIGVAAPTGAVGGVTTFARFRLSTDGGLQPTGAAVDGEVEDYALTLIAKPSTVYAGPAFDNLELGIDPDESGPIIAVGFDAFTSLDAARAAVEPGGDVIYYAPGTAGDDRLEVSFVNNVATYSLNGTPLTLPTGVDGFGFAGQDGNDVVSLNLEGGSLATLVGKLYFHGGAQTTDLGDGLIVNGSGSENATYTPSATTYGDGAIDIDQGLVVFSGLEPVDMQGMATATLNLPGADDVVTLTNGVDFLSGGTNQAIRATGTSNGVAFESAAFWNNTTVVINTAVADGNDTITIASANNAHNNQNLTINTGATGTDSVTSNGSAIVTGTVAITVNGQINDGNAAGLNIQAATLSVTAALVDLDINVNTLNSNTSIAVAVQTFREVNNTAIGAMNAGTGAIVLASGTFNLSSGTSLSDTSDVSVLTPAVLNLNGFNEGIRALLGTGSVNLGGNTLTFLGGNTSTASFSGLLAGTGGIVKQGTGTQALAGNNTGFTGTTTVTGGVLQITAATGVNPLGTSSVTLNGGNMTFAGVLTPGGLLGRYYNQGLPNINGQFPEFSSLNQTNSYLLNLTPATTASSNVNFDNAGFGGGAPFASVGFAGTDNIIAYWSGKIDLPAGATNFNARSDDGTMIFINGQTVVNNNFFQGATTRSGTFNAPTAGLYDIVVTFYEGGGGAGAQAWDGAAGTPSGFNAPILAYQPQLALNNNINVTGNSAITVTDMVGVTLGNLTHTVGTTLSSNGAGILQFNGTTTYTGSGTATYDVANGGGDLVFNGQVNDAANNVTIVKSGPGQVIYNNTSATANDLDGPVNVTGGQFVLIGTNGGTNPADTATINLNTAGVSLVQRSKVGNPTFANPINFNANATLASYMATAGAITNINTGAIALGAGVNGTLLAFDSDQQLDGQITGTGNLVKQGNNTSILNNNTNSYSGLTDIQVGALAANQSNALGATTGDVSVSVGGQLQLRNNITIPAGETVTIRGTGPGNGGALRNENGNNTITDGILLGASATIFGNGGTLTLPGGITLGNFGLTVDGGGTVTVPGVISGANGEGLLEGTIPGNGFDQTSPNPATATVLGPQAGRETTNDPHWPNGARTWIYTGQFFDADGVFSFAENIDDNVLVKIDGVTVLNNTVWNVPTTTGVVNVSPGWHNIDIRFGDGGGGAGAVAGSGWTATHGFGLNVNGSTSTDGSQYTFPLEPAGGGATLFRIVDGGITRQGTGTLRLTNAANSYAGATTITGGRVQITNNTALGTTDSGTFVSGTGTLELDGAFDFTTTELLRFSGTGVGGVGALNSINGNRNVPIPLVLTGSTTIGSGTAGNTMTITGAITWPVRSTIAFAGAGDINVTSVLGTGAPPTTTNGLEERIFNFAFDANTVQNNVSAMLSTPATITKTLTNHLSFADDAAFNAEAGVTLPDAFSALWFASFTPSESGVWQFQYNNVDDNASVWIDFNQNGVFENVGTERIHARGCCGGSGVISTPGLTLGQSYDFVIAMSDTGGGSGMNDFEIKSPSGSFEDLIASNMVGRFGLTSPANSIVKNGTGTVTLSGANAYDGRTTINGGTLVAAHATALGLTVGNTVINSGGTLGFAGNVTVTNEQLLVNGIGTPSRPGAIANISGNNTYTGNITAQVVSQGQVGIGSVAGTLTVNGPINLQFSRLVFGGAGDTVINSVISGNGASAFTPGINERIYNGVPADAQANIEAYRNAALGPADAAGVLTSHLNYPDDNAFSARSAALGAVGFDNGDFSAVWTSRFTPNETGVWGFRFNNLDDNASMWVDYDQDGILEQPGALGNERFYNRGCCGGSGDQFTTSLTTGQVYLFGIAMSDTGGGGNFVNAEVKSPSGGWVPLNPSTLGTMFTIQTIADNSIVKNGTGNVTLNAANTYNGNTTINQGTLIVANNAALGTASPGTTVNAGGSLGFQGGVNYVTNELLTINGAGQGGAGAIRNISGNNRFVPNIQAQTVGSGMASIGSDAGTLTLEGTIGLALSSLSVVGAGNVVLNGVISGLGAPTFVPSGGWNGQYYDLDSPPNSTSAAEALLRGTSHSTIPLEGMAPGAVVFTPRVDFGDNTETVPGDGTVLDRGGWGGNPFGGIGVNVGLDNIAGVWTGFINIPVGGADYEFTTRSDDGSRLWVDVNNDGTYDATEMVVDNNFFQGMTNRSGVRTLTAGLHKIRIAGYEGGGGAGFQASWAQLTGAGAFARRIIEPAAFRDESNVAGGLTGRYYAVAAATTLIDPVGLPLPLQALTVTQTALTPRVDFGVGTEAVAGDGSVLDRGGTGGNPFGGLGVNVGDDQHAGVWTGRFVAPQNATYRFTTRSDDGTILYIDGKRVVDNNFFQGMTNRSGDIILTAGVHDILAAGYEGGGGAGFQVSWEQLNGTSPFARRIMEPTVFGDVFASNNQLVKSGAGTLTLNAANTYNNGTIINGGVILANNTTGSATGPAAVAVNNTGTLGGNGTIAGVITVNNGGTLSPGVAGVGDIAVITPVFNATGTYNAQFAPGPNNGILAVTGAVNLGGNVNLTVTTNGGFIPAPSSTFVIIQNDGADPVVGTFAGLPEGAQFTTNFLGSGLKAFVTYTAGTGNDVGIFVAGPVTFNGTAANEDFEIRRVDAGGGVHLLQVLQPFGGAVVFSAPYAAVSTFTINALDGNDNVFVNHGATGGFIDAPLFINGGNGTDTLRVGGGTVVTVTHTFTNNSDGSLDQGGTLLSYTTLEGATDNLGTTNRVFTFNGAGETIVLDDDPAAGVSRIDSTLGVVTAFNNPSTLLTINLTGGNDTLNVQGLDAGFNAGLTITQDGGETVSFQSAPTNLGGGALNVTANTIAFSQTVTTTGNANLTAVANITNTGAAVDIAAANLVANSGTGVDLDTTVTNLTVTSTGAGNIQIDETNGANVLNAAAGTGNVVVTTTTGSLNVTTASATTGNVTVAAPAGAITDANAAAVNVTASGSLTATSASGVALDTNVSSITATASAAGAIGINEANAVALTSVTAANGPITITAGGATTATNVVATSGPISMTVTGAAILTNVVASNGPISVNAAGAITATNVASTTDTDANDIILTATAGNIAVTTITAGTGVSGDVTLSAATGSITDDNVDTTRIVGDVVMLTVLNDIGQPLTGPATEDIDTTANTISATATGTLAGTHGIWLDETNSVALPTITTADGLVRITTAGNTTATTITAGGTGRNATIITTVGSIFADSITADLDRITLTAPAGIQEVGAGDAGVDLTAASLVLTSGTGVGIGVGGAFETATGALEADGGSGGISLTNTGNLTVGGLTALVGLTTTGAITLVNGGAINANENIIATGNVSLTATDAAAAGQNINAIAGVNIGSSAGSVTINAGDDVSLPTGTIVSAATGITVNVDFGNADPGIGGTLDFAGDVDDTAGPVTAAIFNGNTDTFGDSFNIRPDQDAGGFVPISVFGFAPLANPNGDNMTLNLTGLTDRTLTLGGVNSGQWSFGTQAAAVAYNSIENVGGTGGNFNLVLDMLFGGFQNGVADTVLVRLDAPGTSLLIDVNGINQFTGPDASILSFTIIGSGDADTLQIVETAGGMPFFTGAAPAIDNTVTGGGISNGSHINSVSQTLLTAQFPAQAPWDANDATFHFAGGGGTDTVQITYITPHSAGVSSDTLDTAGSGNVGSFRIGGPTADLLASFAGVENVTLNGAGGLAYIDASLTAATTVQVSNTGGANDGTNQVTANAPFTPVTFSNFNQALIVGGPGSQTMDVVSTDSGGTIPLTSLQVSGDNTTGTDTASDTLRIQSSTAGVVTTLIGAGGNDLFQVFSTSNTVDNILGQVVVNAGAGIDTLTVTDIGSATGNTVTITQTQIDGLTGFAGTPDIIYSGGLEILDVTGTSGNDIMNTTLAGGTQLTSVTVSGANGDDDLTLVTTDPVTGLTNISLVGNDGLDDFGTVATPIRPNTTLPVTISGGNPTGPVLPVSDSVGDRLRLDMTATTGPVIVNTIGGVAVSASHQPVNFTGIEDIDLVDDTLTAVQMGDLYVRTTDANDFLIFSRLVGGDPNLVRVRVNATFQDVIVTRALIAYSRGGDDYLNHSNVTLSADFFGEAGQDYISGGVGNDRLVGGSGADLINGSLGNNEIWGDNLGEQMLVTGGDDTLSGLSGNDVFYGGGGNDQISAGAGNDYIYGGAGDDTIGGAQGDDRIYGDAGHDVMSGDEGNDLLSGGDGNDQLMGRDGNDVLIAGSGADAVDGGGGNDLIISGGVMGETSFLPGDAVDIALMALLTNWGSTGSNRTGLPVILPDSDIDSVLGQTGDDDFSAGGLDLVTDFGIGADEQF